MSLIGASIKLLACVAVVGGVTGYPYIFATKDLSPDLPKARKRRSLNLGTSTSQKESSLSLSNMTKVEEFLKGKGLSLSFKDLGMKWGDKELSEKDILHSPNQDGIYYLWQHQPNGTYKFEDGQQWLNSWETNRLSSLKHIYLGWSKSTPHSITSPNLTVGTCSLFREIKPKNPESPKLKIVCYQFPRNGGMKAQGELKEEDFEYE